jgi:hypothetical protein
MLTQVDPGGILPAVVINSICTMGPPSYFKQIELAAQRKPSKQVLQEKLRVQAQRKKEKSKL